MGTLPPSMLPSSPSQPMVGRRQDESIFRCTWMLICGDRGGCDGPTATMASRDFLQSAGKWYVMIEPSTCLNLKPTAYAIFLAGIPLEKAAGTNTAVYASSTSEDYIMMIAKDPDNAPQMVSTSTSPSIQANRLSWYFDLRGPSIHVNTACSSSMITMDLACQSLRSGQSSMVCGAGRARVPETYREREKR